MAIFKLSGNIPNEKAWFTNIESGLEMIEADILTILVGIRDRVGNVAKVITEFIGNNFGILDKGAVDIEFAGSHFGFFS